MYTSGSTGVAKGVSVTHRSVVRLVKETNYAEFGAGEVFLQAAPLSFDASTFEIWGSLLNGGRLVLMQGDKASLAQLAEAIKRYQITTLWLTAGLFHQMVESELESLRGLKQLLVGGDVLSVPHVEQVARELPCQLINGYGPTENTTFTCCYRVPAGETLATMPIGLPVTNTIVHILDEQMQPVSFGEAEGVYGW
jgi:non-ribosomal peptide synthetase component F